MKTGVYGGTFNPVHKGHIHIVKEFMKRLSLDRVLLIPTFAPPHKVSEELAPSYDRLEMCRLAIKDEHVKDIFVSDVEIQRKGKSYTAETLKTLSGEYPEDELFLIMGEDMFLTVEKWKDPETIFNLASICTSPRSYTGIKQMKAYAEKVEKDYGAKVFIEDIPYLAISSTVIRNCVKSNNNLEEYLTTSVIKYIQDKGLYRNDIP